MRIGITNFGNAEIIPRILSRLECDCACCVNLSILLIKKICCNLSILGNWAISKLKCSAWDESCCFDGSISIELLC